MGGLAKQVKESQGILCVQEELEVNLKVSQEELSIPVNSVCKGPEVEGNHACKALKGGQT